MWQTNYMDPELLQYILNNIQNGNSNQMSQIEPLTGMYKGDAITGIQSANGNMWGVNTQNNPVAPQQGMPQYNVSENYTQNPNILAEAQIVQTLRDVNALEMDKYNKMMMEDYLNKQSFGTGSQVTGTMPYYADRMGRGIQSGNAGQIIGGGLGFLFQGFKGAMAGAGQQKTEDFLKTEGQQKMREYMKAGKGRESLYNNFAMGYSGNFAEGGRFTSNDLYGKTAQELYELQGKLREVEGEDAMSDEEFDKLDYNRRFIYNFINDNPYIKTGIELIQAEGLTRDEENRLSAKGNRGESLKNPIGKKSVTISGKKVPNPYSEKVEKKWQELISLSDKEPKKHLFGAFNGRKGERNQYFGQMAETEDDLVNLMAQERREMERRAKNKQETQDESYIDRSLIKRLFNGEQVDFAEGGEMPMEEQMPMEQEIPQEQIPQGEDVIFAYFEANQFNEQQAQEFMQYFQSLAPEEQQAAIQEMAAALSPQQSEQPEQEEMEEEKEEPTILDGKTMSESTKVVRKGKKDFLQIIQETPISKKEAKDFRKFM